MRSLKKRTECYKLMQVELVLQNDIVLLQALMTYVEQLSHKNLLGMLSTSNELLDAFLTCKWSYFYLLFPSTPSLQSFKQMIISVLVTYCCLPTLLQENTCKPKEKIPSDLARNSISSCGETNRDVIFDLSSIHREKPSLRSPCTKKKPKVIKRSKVGAKHQKHLCPVRGILKKHTKVLSRKNPSFFNIKSSIEEPGIASQPEKHVHFLVEDDMGTQGNPEASSQQSGMHARLTGKDIIW